MKRVQPHILTPAGTIPQPLWPNHEGIFGASDASRHEPSPALLATHGKMKGLQGPCETQTKITPQLELAAHLKADAMNIAQDLKITEEHGKDKSLPNTFGTLGKSKPRNFINGEPVGILQ